LLVVPTSVPATVELAAKLSDVGVRVTVGVTPLPLTLRSWGPLAALSAIVTVAAKGAEPTGVVLGTGLGVNVTDTVHEPPGAIVLPQVVVAAK
jgi:hypothetical protein